MEKARIDYKKFGGDAYRAMAGLERYVHQCGLEPKLLELVKFRASQMNGCAYCMDMHSKDARQAGESEQRLFTISSWRETPFFTERERAALAWTEAVTRISPESVDDGLYAEVRKHFSEKEIVDLTLAVITINGWNRLAISFRSEPGTYQPQAAKSA
jgi:AhpD family alkylhydroperoxidase